MRAVAAAGRSAEQAKVENRTLADRASQGMTLQNNDTDQDGKVSRDEFLGGAVAWMGMLDRDTDGVVTTADFGR